MADLKLLVPELNEAEAMGAETARFQELLLQASKELQQAQTSRPESTQIQPQPGFCVKTNSSEGKVFINICHSPSIPPPADMTEDQLLQMLEEDQAGFRIPMSLGEPHAELDAKGQGCTAYDVAVNSDFYRRMQVGGVAAGEAWAGAAPFTLEPSRSPAPRSVLEQRFPARAGDHHRQGGPGGQIQPAAESRVAPVEEPAFYGLHLPAKYPLPPASSDPGAGERVYR